MPPIHTEPAKGCRLSVTIDAARHSGVLTAMAVAAILATYIATA
jgi:hypothetical protein